MYFCISLRFVDMGFCLWVGKGVVYKFIFKIYCLVFLSETFRGISLPMMAWCNTSTRDVINMMMTWYTK